MLPSLARPAAIVAGVGIAGVAVREVAQQHDNAIFDRVGNAAFKGAIGTAGGAVAGGIIGGLVGGHLGGGMGMIGLGIMGGVAGAGVLGLGGAIWGATHAGQ